MVKLTRIYTRGGDKGKTTLGDGSRVSKNDLRINTIGNIDEANATLGLVKLYLTMKDDQEIINRLQHDLFDVGADLCYPSDTLTPVKLRINTFQVQRLEFEITKLNNSLEPLNSFVLPGGTTASAYLHLARTVIRRAERSLCALHEVHPLNPCLIQYLNRLSDYCFVMGRYFNNMGKDDILWIPGKNQTAGLDIDLKDDLMHKNEA